VCNIGGFRPGHTQAMPGYARACRCHNKFLGRLVQCEQKGWDRGRWVGIYTQRVKTAWLCVGLAVKIPP